MVQVYASHHELDPTEDVPGMGIEYVYHFEYEKMRSRADEMISELECKIAALQRVIVRQDAMLVAKDEFSDR